MQNLVTTPKPPKINVATTMRLDVLSNQGTGGWEFNNGDEFSGASGTLESIEGPTSTSPELALTTDH